MIYNLKTQTIKHLHGGQQLCRCAITVQDFFSISHEIKKTIEFPSFFEGFTMWIVIKSGLLDSREVCHDECCKNDIKHMIWVWKNDNSSKC